MKWSRAVALLAILAAIATACSSAAERTGEDAADPPSRPLVLTTTVILADIVQQSIGGAARVEAMVERTDDPAVATPSSADVLRLDDATLVVAIGLDYETGFTDVLADAESRGVPVLRLGPRLDPLPEFGEDHGSDRFDPYFWTDPARVADAVDLIGARLSELRPELNTTEVATGVVAYSDDLRRLDDRVAAAVRAEQAELTPVMAGRPMLQYFAERYDVPYLGSIVAPGPPGSRLLDGVETRNVLSAAEATVIVVDTIVASEDVLAVADRAGADVTATAVISLDVPTAPTGNYIGLIDELARVVIEAATRQPASNN